MLKRRPFRKSYDERCFELAEYFLQDEPQLREDTSFLAAHIQQAIEDWIEWEKSERSKAQ